MTDKLETVAIIPCTGQKDDNPGPAKEVWIGHHFQLPLLHAEEWYDRILIMSFKYGMITPETEIEPYDRNIHDEPMGERMKWRRMVMHQIAEICEENPPGVVGLYVGKRDVSWLAKAFKGRAGAHIILPWSGMGIGQRIEAAYLGDNPFEVDEEQFGVDDIRDYTDFEEPFDESEKMRQKAKQKEKERQKRKKEREQAEREELGLD